MKFAYHDLGEQPEGQIVRVGLKGNAANVLLLDGANFVAYRARQPFYYDAGGHYNSPVVELTIPSDGRWFVVVDLGGYSGRVRASVELPAADGEHSSDETVLRTVHA
jgi:hypothetical protein